MSDCKVKINVDICGESALDAVTKLVVGGLSVNKACKQVAEEFNAKNDGATVKANTLRQSYKRAQKVGTCTKSDTIKVGTCTNNLVPLDVPMVDNSTTNDCVVDTTKYITIEEHRAVLAKIIAEFEEVIATLSSPDVIVTAPVEELTKGITRQKVYEFVQKYGNEIQCTVLKDEHLTNEKLFKVFVKVRDQYKAATPPPAWDMDIVNAEFIQ